VVLPNAGSRNVIAGVVIASALLVGIGMAGGKAVGQSVSPRNAVDSATLVDAWLAYPGLAELSAPYGFIRTSGIDGTAESQRQTILGELENLDWRLEQAAYTGYVDVVAQWRERLKDVDVFREPGRWDLAWLLSHPRQVPPIARVSAIGGCEMPDWVEVWDDSGVHRYAWSPQSTLSSLLQRQSVTSGPKGRVTVVSPDGRIETYGIQSWNFQDTNLAPGTRIVAALPLSGAVFPWLRNAIARFLSYTPSGDDCRSIDLVKDTAK